MFGASYQGEDNESHISAESLLVLLVAVNTSLVILLLVFLVSDYRREIVARVAEKHTASDEEAKTGLPGIVWLRPEG